MTIVCKPVGRGNWKPIVLNVVGDRAAPLLVKIGDKLTLANIQFRICEIRT